MALNYYVAVREAMEKGKPVPDEPYQGRVAPSVSSVTIDELWYGLKSFVEDYGFIKGDEEFTIITSLEGGYRRVYMDIYWNEDSDGVHLFFSIYGGKWEFNLSTCYMDGKPY